MKIDRVVSIIMILLDKKRIGAQELADKFEVSTRTIYRDIDTINMAGIPVLSTSGVGGGFEIMPNYKIDKNVFSTADISSILMGLTGLSNLMRGDELVNALAKVKSFIPVNSAKDIEIKSNQIYIDLSPWMGNKNIPVYLELIKTGFKESRLLSFKYSDRYGNTTTRVVEPYQLVLKSHHWYCFGYCRIRGDFRLFKLSRISDLVLLSDCFIPRDFKKPQLKFDDILEKKLIMIKLRIHKSILDRVLEYCTFECVKPERDEYYIVNYPFIENEYYYNILLSFGENCECLEPSHIRSELIKKIKRITDVYR